ncbi:N-formylglutamate deformylase [invertebrate metagenome]|uniref:N-formylglutamate deformylase n=1 Tax=invertebrate metagenome TaxID=1711999 RepID=A0A484HD81_9ZZZZ
MSTLTAPHQVVDVLAPAEQKVPFVFASPHSGSDYPPDFIRASVLDPVCLRQSEDFYVDQIFTSVVNFGAPLIRALFPRVFLDPNREPYELDPTMFADDLPAYVNTRSPRLAAGLGTIAKVVSTGAHIYASKLRFAEAEQRIHTFYQPYHQTLQHLVEVTRQRFGYCVVVDCHSMPSSGGIMDADPQLQKVDFVLGDRFGTSCARVFITAAELALKAHGYHVIRNKPYAGGYTTCRYGHPNRHIHAFQIEINRRLYVDEKTYAPLPGLEALQETVIALVAALVVTTQQIHI